VAAAALAPLAGCSSSEPEPEADSVPQEPQERPHNILVLYTDDQRFDTLRFMPTLQRLQREGTTFTQARQSTPLCTPSRASLLTGQQAVGPHGHGLTGNDDKLPRERADDGLAAWLDGAGYHCGMIGKYFDTLQALRVPEGWSTWRALVKGRSTEPTLAPIQDAHDYGLFDGERTRYPERHQAELQTREVLDFVERAPEPWFLWDCPTSPHYPPQPTPRRAGADVETEWPVVDDDTSDKPSWLASQPAPTDEEVAGARAEIADVLREVIDLDDHLAAVWERLRRRGLAERTTIIVTSDNGTSFIDHRLPLYSKNIPYDVASRVPLVCVGRGFEAGAEVDAPVSAAIDVTATCLAVAGARASVPQDGTSLLEPARPDRVTRGSCAAVAGAEPAIPTNDWIVADLGAGLRKLIRYQGVSGPDELECYDLDTDPEELTNWAGDPARRTERDELAQALDDQLA
jgi:arylsulfatase A-like enzyme